MPDGEVEVSVQAEGVEDAVGEMDPGAAAGGVGGPDGGGGGRMGGKLIARLVGLLAVLGPILDIIGIVSDILEAFVAPVAVLLLRLLQPALRLLLSVLPIWFAYTDILMDIINGVESFRSDLITALFSSEKRVRSVIASIPDRIGSYLTTLAGDIAAALKEEVPGFGSAVDAASGPASNVRRGFDLAGEALSGERDINPVEIAIGGGLQPFVDKITQDGSFDFP